MTDLWRRSHWLIKWTFISFAVMASMVFAEKVGLWVPDTRPLKPPFNLKKCRIALAKEDYPSVTLDELEEDIQFEYRQRCSSMALEYQGYVE